MFSVPAEATGDAQRLLQEGVSTRRKASGPPEAGSAPHPGGAVSSASTDMLGFAGRARDWPRGTVAILTNWTGMGEDAPWMGRGCC